MRRLRRDVDDARRRLGGPPPLAPETSPCRAPPAGIYLAQLPEREARLHIVHLETVRPYRPLPLFREDTIVQHYMQPEEFRQFFDQAYGGAKSVADKESDDRIAQVYDLFVGAKVMRR